MALANITNNILTDTGVDVNKNTITIEFLETQSTIFYAAQAMRINTVTNLVASPTTTILVNDAAYTLTNLITIGSKITVSVSVESVINLNATNE